MFPCCRNVYFNERHFPRAVLLGFRVRPRAARAVRRQASDEGTEQVWASKASALLRHLWASVAALRAGYFSVREGKNVRAR